VSSARPGTQSRDAASARGTTVRLPARATRPRLQQFGRLLRAWYRRHARDLPWRRTSDPYAILVSELMLQQTQVSRVVPRWHEFLDRFPTLQTIAVADVHEVEAAWEGLGYYARARNLHKTARLVTRDGTDTSASLPMHVDELHALPGIGRYTAGAVSSFAYRQRAPLVDTNVARVLRRVFAPRLPRGSARSEKVLWALADATLPARAGDATWTHNQALMELGALVCTARIAHCERCPVRGVCASAKPAPVTRRTK
jgi:A/G-specific adenine glycosylase